MNPSPVGDSLALYTLDYLITPRTTIKVDQKLQKLLSNLTNNKL